MRVKVRPVNVHGRPEFKDKRERREVYAGELKLTEDRLHKMRRVVTTARVVTRTGDVEPPMIEIYDASDLWIDGPRMRIRGFEDVGGVQYAQTWDVEVA